MSTALDPGLALVAAMNAEGVGMVAVAGDDPDRHVYVSAAAARLLGYDLAELEGLSPRAYQLYDVAEGRSATLRRKDGSELHVRLGRERLDGSEVFVFRPVADARADFRLLLDVAPDGLAVLGRRGLIYANPVLLRWVGYSDVASLAQAKVTEILHTEDVSKAAQALGSVLDSPGKRAVVRVRVRRPAGGLLEAECVAHGVDWAGERACLIVARDLSQRQHDQSRLIVADRSASVGTMSAGVAHEINNPLAYLLLNLEYLIREIPAAGGDPARLSQLAERVHESRHGAERVGHILKELGSLSSRRRGRRSGVDLGEAVRRAVHAVEPDVAPRATVVVENLGVPKVDADPNSLEQLFVNVLSNAGQAFTHDRPSDNRIVVRLSRGQDGGACVEVTDNGPGIAPELLNRIFDPFFTTKPTGTGLGLPISHAIARAFGGQITAHSEPGKGTTFRIVFPEGTAPKAEAPRTSSLPAPAMRRARVLVVDDEELVAETVSRALAESYDVQVSTSARDALKVLANDPGFDVVLCDLLMPDMSGMDLYRALAEAQPGLEESLVFMTGGAFTQRARDFLARVRNPRLEKPFELDQLHFIVGQRLEVTG
ncbi:MAG: response regulator [Myxococcales bacterium]|nr:response regulator [Myxococcales bacterium]